MLFFRFRAFRILDLSLWAGLIRGNRENKIALLHKINDRYLINVYLTEETLIESTLVIYLFIYISVILHTSLIRKTLICSNCSISNTTLLPQK